MLDRQLQATVTGFNHTPGSIVTIGDGKTSADLRAALESGQARVIITTRQKFSVVAQATTDLAGTRYFASDERRELIDDFLIRSLYGVIRGEAS